MGGGGVKWICFRKWHLAVSLSHKADRVPGPLPGLLFLLCVRVCAELLQTCLTLLQSCGL